jgi:hypothetical protein
MRSPPRGGQGGDGNAFGEDRQLDALQQRVETWGIDRIGTAHCRLVEFLHDPKAGLLGETGYGVPLPAFAVPLSEPMLPAELVRT